MDEWLAQAMATAASKESRQAFLDVHHSLPYMQRHMEARGFGDCDLYTFVKFSLLNCLVTDPSSPTPMPVE